MRDARYIIRWRNFSRADGKSTGVGDEGGFAPDLRDEREALRYITDAVEKAGYSGRVEIALDVAASEWQKGNGYVLPKSGESLTSDEGDRADRETLRRISDNLG